MVRDRVWVAPQMSQGDREDCREFMAEEERASVRTWLASGSNGNPRKFKRREKEKWD